MSGSRFAGLFPQAIKWHSMGLVGKAAAALILVYFIVVIALGFYWTAEPDSFDVTLNAQEKLPNSEQVVGSTTAAALMRVAETMLDKPGGFLSNDIAPPGLYLDNIPNWEYGVLIQVRDLALAFRQNFSRSQSQSTEDPDLLIVEPRFSFPNDSWIFPASETEYRRAINSMSSYLSRIADPLNQEAQFYARADNLSRWLANVESRLGSLSQRLSASIGQTQVNVDTAGDRNAQQSTTADNQRLVKTPYTQIDDVFYEARGATWALMHFLRAIEVDFESVLRDKNALVSVRQIIRELEASQRTVLSPIILNGRGFGFFANHSLVMANYVSRANAAIIDLRELLNQG
ncbi:MAG: DUF2333 family protein [Gammaproteobacteria bacterium]